MLELRQLTVRRGGMTVLHGIDMDIAPGGITALLGANGAGKSSLVLAVAGALAVASGWIAIDGAALQNFRPEQVRAAGVAVVPQGHRVLSELSVRDNLRVAAAYQPKAQAAQAVERAVAVFPELQAQWHTLGSALSGGQQQMVCIAQALVAAPRYLLLDELSLGLAPVVVKRLAEVVRQTAAQGVGVLLIEQFTSLALELASQACVLERGRMVFSGSAELLRTQPDILHSSYLAAA